nr:immunoglobulin light chain junction region [Macaca mulatta]MOW59158.1 immunoglobulin light chain junction region [Macaca mulatta]MOW59359.1 immunoglobulin light chain junction region [Macaca mulatta]MOW61460.1 immunoglobulin light chain junction region [Macaca mulatta]
DYYCQSYDSSSYRVF